MSNGPATAAIIRQKWVASEHDCQPAASPEEQQHRHGHWAQARHWTFAALGRTGATERQLDAFANCGNSLWLVKSRDDLALRCNTCRHRWCDACAREKRATLVAAVGARIKAARARVRFVTLTLKTQPVGLLAQLDRLLACFRRLRQRKWWSDKVEGGCLFVEVKIGENSGAWHVHGHILVEGDFIPQHELGEVWHEITGDSYVVDVRAVVEDAKVASYVAKYATKPCGMGVLQHPDKLDEAVVALRGRRLVVPFGSWHGLDAEDPEPTTTWVSVGRVDALFSDARGGDAQAISTVRALLRKFPRLSASFGTPPALADEAAPP